MNFIAKTRTRNREGLSTSHKNYFACFGRGKMEEEDVRGCKVIHNADEGDLNLFRFFPLKAIPLPHHSALATRLIQKGNSKKSMKFGKNVDMLDTHSFSTRAAGLI